METFCPKRQDSGTEKTVCQVTQNFFSLERNLLFIPQNKFSCEIQVFASIAIQHKHNTKIMDLVHNVPNTLVRALQDHNPMK